MKRWRTEHKEYMKAHFLKWFQLHWKEYYLKNKSKMFKKHKLWKKTSKAKKLLRKYEKNHRKNQPHKVRARQILRDAIRSGKMKRGTCLVCGEINAQAHHIDYSKPFEVIWLCRKHHAEEHSRLKNGF